MSTSLPVPRASAAWLKAEAEPPPPPPTAYQRLRSRREAHRGLPGPGHATHSRTLGQREASANQRCIELPARNTRAPVVPQ